MTFIADSFNLDQAGLRDRSSRPTAAHMMANSAVRTPSIQLHKGRGMELRLNTLDSLRVQAPPLGEMNTPGNTGAGNSSASCGEPMQTAPWDRALRRKACKLASNG